MNNCFNGIPEKHKHVFEEYINSSVCDHPIPVKELKYKSLINYRKLLYRGTILEYDYELRPGDIIVKEHIRLNNDVWSFSKDKEIAIDFIQKGLEQYESEHLCDDPFLRDPVEDAIKTLLIINPDKHKLSGLDLSDADFGFEVEKEIMVFGYYYLIESIREIYSDEIDLEITVRPVSEKIYKIYRKGW